MGPLLPGGILPPGPAGLSRCGAARPARLSSNIFSPPGRAAIAVLMEPLSLPPTATARVISLLLSVGARPPRGGVTMLASGGRLWGYRGGSQPPAALRRAYATHSRIRTGVPIRGKRMPHPSCSTKYVAYRPPDTHRQLFKNNRTLQKEQAWALVPHTRSSEGANDRGETSEGGIGPKLCWFFWASAQSKEQLSLRLISGSAVRPPARCLLSHSMHSYAPFNHWNETLPTVHLIAAGKRGDGRSSDQTQTLSACPLPDPLHKDLSPSYARCC